MSFWRPTSRSRFSDPELVWTDPKGLSLTFLGTTSGGTTASRNSSTTALTFPGCSWLVDCAEDTQKQMKYTRYPVVRDVNRVFITQMRGRYIFGLVPLMGALMFPQKKLNPDAIRLRIYGPAGVRAFVRMTLNATGLVLGGKYQVIELLSGDTSSTSCLPEDLHPNEAPGEDILVNEDGTWPNFARAPEATISAALLDDSIPSLGYVFQEPHKPITSEDWLQYLDSIPHEKLPAGMYSPRQLSELFSRTEAVDVLLADGTPVKPPSAVQPGRKIVILGTTGDPSRIASLAQDADVLVHEAGFVPETLTCGAKAEGRDTEKARELGRSTPRMAGAFADQINARKLVLNNFGSYFEGLLPRERYNIIYNKWDDAFSRVTYAMAFVTSQALEKAPSVDIEAAHDLLVLPVPLRDPEGDTRPKDRPSLVQRYEEAESQKPYTSSRREVRYQYARATAGVTLYQSLPPYFPPVRIRIPLVIPEMEKPAPDSIVAVPAPQAVAPTTASVPAAASQPASGGGKKKPRKKPRKKTTSAETKA